MHVSKQVINFNMKQNDYIFIKFRINLLIKF